MSGSYTKADRGAQAPVEIVVAEVRDIGVL